MAQTLASVNVRIGAQISDLEKGLKKAERALLRSGREMQRIGGNLTTSLTLPIAAAGAASLKFASDFESSFLKINTLVGITGNTLDQFRQGISDLSGPLAQSQQQLSEGLFVITSAGQRGAEALETLEAASKASAIGLGQTNQVARVAVAAMTAYKESNLTAVDAIDKFTAIARAGNFAIEELAPSIGKVLPIAAQLGVSFDEVGANIASFTKLGVSAPESVTALKSLLSSLIKPTKQAAEEFEKLGISADDLRASVAENGLAATLQQLVKAYGDNTEGLARLFGNVEGLANALGTAGAQGEDYLKIVDEIAKSNGIVNEGFEKVSETANFKMKRALVELQNVGVQLGGTLIPVVTDLLGAITPLIGAFSKLNPTLQKVLVSSGLLVATAGPLISAIGSLKTVVAGAGFALKSMSAASDLFKARLELLNAITDTGRISISKFRKSLLAASFAFDKLNTAAKVSVIGVTIAAFGALIAVVNSLRESTSDAAKAARTLNEVNATAAQNIVKEKVAAQQLISVINDETTSKRQKEEALKELNKISPKYFSGLSIEKDSIDKLNTAYDRYIENLLRAAKQQAITNKIVELETRRLEILENIKKLQTTDFVISGDSGVFNLEKQLKSLDEQINSLSKTAREASFGGQGLLSALFGGVSGNIDNLLKPKKPKTDLNLNDPNNTPTAKTSFSGFGDSFAVINDGINESSLGIQKLEKDFKLLSDTTGIAKIANDRMAESLREMKEQLAEKEKIKEFQEAVLAITESGIENTLVGVAEGIGEVFAGTANAGSLLAAVLNPILGMMEQLGKLAIATGIAIGGIKKALESLNPVAAIAGGIALIALSKVVKGQLKSLQPKAFATGGIVRQPTLALVGDNPNAASNPEYILRQDQLRSIAANISPTGNGGGGFVAETMISGNDLRILLRRAENQAARRGGL